jgi:phosphopantothenoylcysteine decarboxylase/phosphopantothenate--cysteine ligase
MNLENRRILLCVTGGIAAYKSAELCRLFVKAGARVQVVMTAAAREFITPLTMETLSGRPVKSGMFGPGRGPVEHVALADEAEILVVAPATADYLARSAHGRASDLASAVTLAFAGPVLAAPAMNTVMWRNPATRRNLALLATEHQWRFVDPGSGDLVCGWVGEGRMAEPAAIFDCAAGMLRGDLTGRGILVTAGPTVEDIDPVRALTNRSSGRMGYAVAERAARRGARVALIAGPTALPDPPGVEVVHVRSALEMQRAVDERAAGVDAVVMAAAVADYRPAEAARAKLKRGGPDEERGLRLVQNPDILAGLGARFRGHARPVLVGFALETGDLLAAARAKLAAKGAHLLVANLAADALEGPDTAAVILSADGSAEETGPLPKPALAERLLDRILLRLRETGPGEASDL